MSARTTADVIAESLALAGVERVFAYPGDPIIELMERFRVHNVDVVLARREGTAAFMAEGHGMLTGRPGVCLSTLGPGSTALVNGVAAANSDRVPLIAISGQIETSREQYFTHQVVDHKLLFSPVTKWAGRVEPGSAATTMRKAIATALAARPGAVHLTITSDECKATARDNGVFELPHERAATTIRVVRTPGEPDPLGLLDRARRPVVLAGIGAVRSEATDALIAFAERASVPVIVSPMAKGVFPEAHPLFAGVLDMACNQVIWDFLSESDLIIAAGFDPVELIKPWSASAPVLHVDALPNTDQIYRSDVECVGDIGAIMAWMTEEWAGEERWPTVEVDRHKQRLRASYFAGRVEGRLNPSDVVDVVRECAPEGTIATTDVGSHKLLVGQGWRTDQPRDLLMTNGLSSMGFGVPAAIAAKLARPDRPVVAIVGDGGFAMTATEVRLAAALNAPVVFIVLVDRSLNRIELKQMAAGYPSTATRIEETDLVALAGAMECDGVRVESVGQLATALEKFGQLSRPLVVEATIDPTQYESQF